MKNMTWHKQYSLLVNGFFIIFITLVSLLTPSAMAFFGGVSISMINAVIYLIILNRHLRHPSSYPAETLAVIVKTTVIRFFLVGILLVSLLTHTELMAATVLLGFVTGQIFFAINQLIMVSKNNGK